MLTTGIKIAQISDPATLFVLLDRDIISLYQQIFAEPPEFQTWEGDRIREMFVGYCGNGKLFLPFESDRPVGFGAIVPYHKSGISRTDALESGSKIVAINPEYFEDLGIVDPWYVADIAIQKDYRRQGLATALMERMIEAIDNKPVLLRVSLCRENAIALYEKLGFQRLPLQQTAHYNRQPFEKIFMVRR